jgi:exodeoxyribonuclease VII large subunit
MSERRPKPGETLSFDFSSPKLGVPPPNAPPPSAAPPSAAPAKQEPRVYTIAQLGRMLGRVLERTFVETIWIEGEVTGARAAPSGHVYFCLKDEEEEAVVDVVVYRSSLTPRSRALVKDGARLRVRGRPMFWTPRGRVQFVGERIEPTGKGAILEALEQLKAKLAAEGLFARERKRPLPPEPRIVGVVTSAGGAVIHDICRVAFRRGGAKILLANAQVQGLGAAESIRRGLRMLQRVNGVDVIIVGRGGGSHDDLSAWSDEHLVRDVAASRVPIVSAVGHEVDVTLVDFAADARAATPSQAAELVVPDANARRRLLEERALRLRRAMHARIAEDRVVAAKLARAFRDPRLLIASAQQRVDERVARLTRIVSRRIAHEREAAQRLAGRLGAAHPRERIARDGATLAELRARLVEATRARLAEERGELAEAAGRLSAMSPLAVLARGYAIATREDGRAVRDAREVAQGERVHVRVANGSFDAEVKRVHE